MRPLALVFLIAGCDARSALVVPEEDTDVAVCVLKWHSETGECDGYGNGYWQTIPRAVFTAWRCTIDETCTESTPIVEASGLAHFLCSEHGDERDYWRVDYITPSP